MCEKGDNFECLSQHTQERQDERAPAERNQLLIISIFERALCAAREWRRWNISELIGNWVWAPRAHRSSTLIAQIYFPSRFQPGQKSTLVSSVERQEFLGDEWKREARWLLNAVPVLVHPQRTCVRAIDVIIDDTQLPMRILTPASPLTNELSRTSQLLLPQKR